MIRRNVDIIAVAVLLAGAAIFAHTRSVVFFNLDRGHIRFTHYHGPHIAVPQPPRLPYTRD